MKTLGVLCLALSVASALASPRHEIERQYKRWALAAKTNDVDTILDVLAPDYTLKSFTGTMIDRKAYEASLRKRKTAGKPATEYVTKIAEFAQRGSVALVTSDETSENPSVDPVTQKKLRLVHTHRYLDTWIRSGDAWRLRSTVTTVESTRVLTVSP